MTIAPEIAGIVLTLVGLLLIYAGWLLCFRGWQNIRRALILAGVLIGLRLGLLAAGDNLTLLDPLPGSLLIGLIGGAIGGLLLAYPLYRYVTLAAGWLLGMAVTLELVLPEIGASLPRLFPGYSRTAAQAVILVIGGFLGMIAALPLRRLIVIITTAFAGAYLAALGIAVLVPVNRAPGGLFGIGQIALRSPWPVFVLILTVLLGMVGVLIQIAGQQARVVVIREPAAVTKQSKQRTAAGSRAGEGSTGESAASAAASGAEPQTPADKPTDTGDHKNSSQTDL